MTSVDFAGRIVVGSDGSPESARAVRWTADFAAARGAGVTLLEAYGHHLAADIPRDAEELEQLRAVALLRLDAEAAGLNQRHPDLGVQTCLAHGTAPRALVDAAETAHLVVLGSRGLTVVRGHLIGAVADEVVTHAVGRVVVVPLDSPDYADAHGPIVVAVDGTPTSALALDFAFEEALQRGLPLLAVTVLPYAELRHDPARALVLGEDPGDLRLDWLREYLAPYAESHPRVQADAQVVVAEKASSALIRASDTASMVVVGSRGRGDLTGLLFGSTSRGLLRHASCPAVVVREGHHADPGDAAG